MYNYYLAGKDHFEADRQAAARLISRIPQIPAAALGNRQFLRRAVTAVAQAGVRQFIDIGSGLPTLDNTHDVAHRVDPGIKVAYVDRDSQAVTHARMLLEKGSEKSIRVLDGDLREPEAVTRLLGDFIDFTEPVCLMLVAVMHFAETPECYRLMAEYTKRIAPGSYLILSHSTADFLSPEEAEAITEEYAGSNARIFMRSREEVSRFFDGLTLLDPAITDVATWRAGSVQAQRTLVYGGVGYKAGPRSAGGH
jgi:O-methyltransferase involved in polyketide biosynthesis